MLARVDAVCQAHRLANKFAPTGKGSKPEFGAESATDINPVGADLSANTVLQTTQFQRVHESLRGQVRSLGGFRNQPFLGNSTVNVVPSPTFEVTVMLPPWAFTTSFTMNSPRPRLVEGL